MYLYNIYISIRKYIYEKDDYQNDYQDEDELDSLLSLDIINHPYKEDDKVIYY